MSLTMTSTSSLSINHTSVKYIEWFKHKSTLDIIKHQIEEEFFTDTPEVKGDLTSPSTSDRVCQQELVQITRSFYSLMKRTLVSLSWYCPTSLTLTAR